MDEKTDSGEDANTVLLNGVVLQSQPQSGPQTLYQFPGFLDKSVVIPQPQLVEGFQGESKFKNSDKVKKHTFQQPDKKEICIYISGLFLTTSRYDNLQWQVLLNLRGT